MNNQILVPKIYQPLLQPGTSIPLTAAFKSLPLLKCPLFWKSIFWELIPLNFWVVS
uniref:Uncharacterized protein n=1 Tax=Sarcophilus harrisii TaxID=9305 RepID=A0A7N4PCI2_SARHA